jgi:UrcA family protein
MTTATSFVPTPALRRALPLALAIGALAIMTTRVHAAELDKVVIDQPVVEVVGHDDATQAPIEKVTVVARIIPDPDTLTTDSGVKLLNDYVHEAASKACFEADPATLDDGTCYRDAIASAKPQIAAMVARAKSARANAVVASTAVVNMPIG